MLQIIFQCDIVVVRNPSVLLVGGMHAEQGGAFRGRYGTGNVMRAFAKIGIVLSSRLPPRRPTTTLAQERPFDSSGFFVGAGGGYAFGARFQFRTRGRRRRPARPVGAGRHRRLFLQ